MGRHLILACDNCIPGDASGWYLPLALGVLVAWAAAFGCVLLAGRREGARRALALTAAGSLAVAPALAVVLLTMPVTWQGVTCGSAASASLERGVPNDAALDDAQLGCKQTGERWVASAAAVGIGGTVAGLVAGGVALLPDGRGRPDPRAPRPTEARPTA